jgi:threonine dehydrogenase-like Zn-dependent dehydrogenase
MRAIQFVAPHRLQLLDDHPVPEPGPGEVLVRCTHVGLCGSDMGPYSGEGRWGAGPWPVPVGQPGHENVGIIVQSRAAGWEEGTAVLAQAHNHCGFAEFIAARPEAMARLPPGVTDLAPYLLAQPLATVLRAFSKTEPVINQRCAVVGLGPIGLLFTAMLRRLGAREVIGIDRIAWRLGWATRLGASSIINATADDPVEAVRTMTGGEMVDLCVEAATTADALCTAAFLLRREGRLCAFGVPRHSTQQFPWLQALTNELRFVTSHGAGCRRFFQVAVDIMAAEAGGLDQILTPRIPWERAAEAFAMYADPAAHVDSLKVTLEL